MQNEAVYLPMGAIGHRVELANSSRNFSRKAVKPSHGCELVFLSLLRSELVLVTVYNLSLRVQILPMKVDPSFGS